MYSPAGCGILYLTNQKGDNVRKSFFSHTEGYTPAAQTLERIALNEGIRAAFKWAKSEGYNIREASHVIQAVTFATEMETILFKGEQNVDE